MRRSCYCSGLELSLRPLPRCTCALLSAHTTHGSGPPNRNAQALLRRSDSPLPPHAGSRHVFRAPAVRTPWHHLSRGRGAPGDQSASLPGEQRPGGARGATGQQSTPHVKKSNSELIPDLQKVTRLDENAHVTCVQPPHLNIRLTGLGRDHHGGCRPTPG